MRSPCPRRNGPIHVGLPEPVATHHPDGNGNVNDCINLQDKVVIAQRRVPGERENARAVATPIHSSLPARRNTSAACPVHKIIVLVCVPSSHPSWRASVCFGRGAPRPRHVEAVERLGHVLPGALAGDPVGKCAGSGALPRAGTVLPPAPRRKMLGS